MPKLGRPHGRLSKTTRLDEDAFSSSRTEEQQYWVGFLMADGCVNYPAGNRSPRISLGLASKDRGHMRKFQRFLKTNHPVGWSGHQYQLQAVSTKIVSDLSKFGILPRKTFTAKVSGLEKKRHFWRGVFDGDGSIFWTKPQPSKSTYRSYPVVSLVGSKELLKQFVQFLGLGSICHHGSIWRVKLSGSRAFYVVRCLYRGAQVYLTRKFKLAKKVLDGKGQGLTPQDSRVALKG